MVELGAVNCLPDSDTATSPKFHRFLQNLEEDIEESGHMEGRASRYYGRGDTADMRSVFCHLP